MKNTLGWLYDSTKSYVWSFTISGVLIILSGIISMLSVPVANCFNKNDDKEETGFHIGEEQDEDGERYELTSQHMRYQEIPQKETLDIHQA